MNYENSKSLINQIAIRTAEILLRNLYERQRNEISTREICIEYGISPDTLRRRVLSGLLPPPQRKRGKSWFPRSAIEVADIKGIL